MPSACPLCRRPADRTHDRCRAALDARLRQIPGLYQLLADVLEPGTAPAARVSGSRTPPMPVRLEPLNLRAKGGIIAILATWETDWRETRGLPAVPARADHEQLLVGDHILAEVVNFLRTHLDWAIEHHPAVDEFAGEIREIVEACYTALGLRSDLKKIGSCPTVDDEGRPCGRTLYADPYLDMIRCTRCHAEWTRARWLILGAAIAGIPATA